MGIKIRQIENVLAVWRKGSFRGASAERHLSQPAMSRSVRAIEDALGVPLFDRSGKEVQLTHYGEVFIQRAEKILLDVAELEREMSLIKGLGSGRLTVAMAVYPFDISGRRALAVMLEQHPGLRIRALMPSGPDVVRMVQHRQVDLGLAEISLLPDSPGFCVEELGQHEVVFYCRPGHPLVTSGHPITTQEIDQYPFAGVAIPPRLAPLFPGNTNVDEATGDLIPPIMVDDLETARCIVASTNAFGAATPLQIEPWLSNGTLAMVPWRAAPLRVNYGFIHLADRSLPPAAQALMAVIREIEREQADRNRIMADKLFRDIGLAA